MGSLLDEINWEKFDNWKNFFEIIFYIFINDIFLKWIIFNLDIMFKMAFFKMNSVGFCDDEFIVD